MQMPECFQYYSKRERSVLPFRSSFEMLRSRVSVVVNVVVVVVLS